MCETGPAPPRRKTLPAGQSEQRLRIGERGNLARNDVADHQEPAGLEQTAERLGERVELVRAEVLRYQCMTMTSIEPAGIVVMSSGLRTAILSLAAKRAPSMTVRSARLAQDQARHRLGHAVSRQRLAAAVVEHQPRSGA